MEVLNADLIPIDDMVFRCIRPKQVSKNIEEEENQPPPRAYNMEDYDDYDPDLPIMHEGNSFYIIFHVPSQLFGSIIGTKGIHLQMYEAAGAKINLQNRGKWNTKDGEITISGSNKKIISDAYHRIMDKVQMVRFRNTSDTHFVSLPVNAPNIQESFLKFKETVLRNYKVRGIDETIFQIPAKLHITIAMLVLLDQTDCQNAIALLTKCKNNLLKDFGKKEFPVEVKGIEYMNDDPSEVNVLYAKVQQLDGDNTLQLIADNIYKEFADAGLSRKQNEKVKLHITLMNTLFRRKLETDEDEENSERMAFDASSILRDLKDFDFGRFVISEIHVSVRYTEEEDGYYKAEHKLKFNS